MFQAAQLRNHTNADATATAAPPTTKRKATSQLQQSEMSHKRQITNTAVKPSLIRQIFASSSSSHSSASPSSSSSPIDISPPPPSTNYSSSQSESTSSMTTSTPASTRQKFSSQQFFHIANTVPDSLHSQQQQHHLNDARLSPINLSPDGPTDVAISSASEPLPSPSHSAASSDCDLLAPTQ